MDLRESDRKAPLFFRSQTSSERWRRALASLTSLGQRRDKSAAPCLSASTAAAAEFLDFELTRLTQEATAFRLLVENADQGMGIVDSQGRLTLFNVQAEKILGWKESELKGESLHQQIHYRYADGRNFPSNDCPMIHSLKTGTPVRNQKNLWIQKDGGFVSVVCFCIPLQQQDQISGAVVGLREIETLGESFPDLPEFHFGEYPDPVYALDENLKILYTNETLDRLLGYARGELLGQSVALLEASEGIDDADRWETLKRTGRWHGSLYFSAKRGSCLCLETVIQVHRQGSRVIFIAELKDRSSRFREARLLLQTRDRLSEAQAELAHFAYVASHDLQEPLRMISSYVTLLRDRYRGQLGPDADDFIHFASDGAKNMKRLIDGMLAYSRAGTVRLKPVRVASSVAVHQALKKLEPLVQGSGAQISIADLPEVDADPDLLASIFEFLIDNSIKFHDGIPPQIEIGARPLDSGCWLFSVRDRGIGFAKDQSERIFRLFQRLHARGEYEGNGVGLAVCRRMVERHGGKIWAEPGEVDKGGAVFYFTLPDLTRSPSAIALAALEERLSKSVR